MIEVGKFLICITLFIGLLFVGHHLNGVRKTPRPWAPDVRKEFRASVKAVVYTLVAFSFAWLILHHLGIAGTIFGLFVAIILVATIVLAVVDLPASMALVDALLWRMGPQKAPVIVQAPYIRWARRIAMLVFVLFVITAAALNAGTGQASNGASSNSGTSTFTTRPATDAPTTQPATQATTPAPQVTTPTPTPVVSSSAPAQQSITNSCSGPQQIPLRAKPETIPFGTGNVKFCEAGKWQTWGVAFGPLTPAPKKVKITAQVVMGSFLYAQVVDTVTGDPYVIQATHFHVSS